MRHCRVRAAVGQWLKSHRKAVLVHSLILSSFLLFCIFGSGSLFGRLEAISGESNLQKVSLPTEAESVGCQISRVEGGTTITEVRGWACVDGQCSGNSRIYMVLKSDDECYVFDTMSLPRDLANLSLVSYQSGFLCNIPMRKISTGEYIIGIYIEEGDIQGLQYTDSVLVKS